MASIEYGIDGYGRKVTAKEAINRRTYICPYCHEEIHVRKGYDSRKDYFAHNSIHNRTPQQKSCPGYTGEGRIENDVDRAYITNGGLPLYLCEHINGKYQLKAYFPPISQNAIDLLELWDVKIEVLENGRKEEYCASDIRYYRLKSTAEWIKIKCKNLKYKLPEVQQKWEWGIRGLNVEKDIFHSNYGGGYRVALHSNIVVGKEYLIINKYGFKQDVPGITYVKKGSIKFNNFYTSNEFDVYSMLIYEVTHEAIAYIQNKGYQLIEQKDDIIPMWPPAVIEGKELIYRRTDAKAYLYHDKKSEQQLFNISSYGLKSLMETNNVFEVSTDNKTILLSDYQFNSLSNEIRFILTQTRNNFDNKNIFVPNITWIDEKSVVYQLLQNEIELLNHKKVYINANVDFVACFVNGVYVEKTTKRVLDDIRKNRKIIVSIEPFGMIVIEDRKELSKETKSVDIKSIIKELYRCNSVKVPINKDFYDVYKFAINNSEELLKIMESWAVKKQMPYAAARYLNLIKGVI